MDAMLLQCGEPPRIDLHQPNIGRSVRIDIHCRWVKPTFHLGDSPQESRRNAIALSGFMEARREFISMGDSDDQKR